VECHILNQLANQALTLFSCYTTDGP